MTLPASGAISLSQVDVELGRASNAGVSLGETAVRNMSGIASGACSMSNLYGRAGFSAVGNNSSNTYYSASVGGTAYAYPSVTVTGGTAPFTYSWAITSSSGSPVLSNATGAQCTLSHSYARYTSMSFTATLQCVITDATGRQITVTGVTGSATVEGTM